MVELRLDCRRRWGNRDTGAKPITSFCATSCSPLRTTTQVLDIGRGCYAEWLARGQLFETGLVTRASTTLGTTAMAFAQLDRRLFAIVAADVVAIPRPHRAVS